MSETIKEVYEVLKEIINSKKARIIKENINFFLVLNISLLGGKEQEIKLVLEQKNFDLNEINLKLCNKVNCLEKKLIKSL